MPDEVTAQAEEVQPIASEASPEQAATAADSETADKPENTEEQKHKGGFQRRIDRLTKRNYELEEKLDRQAQQVEALLNRLEGKPSAAAAKATDKTSEPTLEQFDTHEQFVKAVARWEARQELQEALKAKETETQQQTEVQRQKQVFDAYNERVSEARGRIDDWDEAVEGAKDLRIPEAAGFALMEMDNGPDVLYHLVKHPDLAKQIGSMSPQRAAAEVGRISATLLKDSDSPPPKPAVSSAPAPVIPVTKPAPSDKGLSDALDPKEWQKRFYARLEKKRG